MREPASPRNSHTPVPSTARLVPAPRALAAAAALTLLAASASAQTDYYVNAIEVNQSIQTGNTPLVGGRATFVRASVRSLGPASPVDGLLRVYVGGVETADSPIYSTNGPALPGNDPNNIDDTLNFTFLAPVSVGVVLEVEVNPAGPNFAPEINTFNNRTSTSPLSFRAQRVAEIAYVPVDYRPSGGSTPNLPDPELIKPGVGDNFVQGIYPVADWDYRRIDAPSKLWTTSLASSGSSLLNSLNADLALMSPPPDFIYGWIAGGLSYNGQANISGKAAMGNTQTFKFQRTFAHELGHNFGLSHNSILSGVIGVDVERQLNITEGLPQLKPTNSNDIMVPGLNTNQAWVAPASYNFFHNHAVFNFPTDAEDADVEVLAEALFVGGLWNRESGAVELTHLVSFESGRATAAAAPEQANLVLRAWSGATLVRELALSARSAGDCSASDSSDPADPVVGFTAVLPAATPGGAAVDRLEVVDPAHPGAPFERTRSAARPAVAFVSPGAGQLLEGPLTVSWIGSDADGDELSYYLRYLPGGGRSVPLASGTTANELVVDPTQLPAPVGGPAYFELFASDGLNTTRLLSEPLVISESTGGNDPWVNVVSPDAGLTFERGATVVLHSSGWDIEDRSLNGSSIAWTSDVDGFLGNGRLTSVANLSVGIHVITVEATDSRGQTATDSTTIEILDRSLPVSVCQTDLGFGGPGSSVLSVCGGDLSSGTVADFVLTGAVPNQPAYLLVALSNTPTPVFGGTLVPVPTDFLIATGTDANGEFRASLLGGGGPFTVYFQMLYADALQVEGVGISNAVQVDFLP